MRRLLPALLLALASCASPNPSAHPPSTSDRSLSPAPAATRTTSPTAAPSNTQQPFATPGPTFTWFAFDAENHASRAVVVGVNGTYAATFLGLEAGQRGTVLIPLTVLQNGIYVEVQGVREAACSVLVPSVHLAAVPFTLVIEDGPAAGTVTTSTRGGASATPLPQPSNALGGCPG